VELTRNHASTPRFGQRMIAGVLIRLEQARSHDREENNLPFAQITMAVIIGVVIADVADATNRTFVPSNYRAVLLIFALLLFLEMYIVLTRYHERLRLPYANLYMFVDLLLATLFVSFVSPSPIPGTTPGASGLRSRC
jgi:hypothetical protein